MKATSAKDAKSIFSKGYFITVGGVTFHYKMAKDEDYLAFLNKFMSGKKVITGKVIMERLSELSEFLLPKYVLTPQFVIKESLASDGALWVHDADIPSNVRYTLVQLIIGGPEQEQQVAAEWENLSESPPSAGN